ncbi:MAG: AAA family ATPase, partial [Myxococcaceae bacterium]|nr:AAA family ATPase [Myxococcaceae bacterium]
MQWWRRVTFKNLLSFGPAGVSVELRPLNVLIGPNGSGKSNFVEAIGLVSAAPSDLTEPIRLGGGVSEWLWKGHGGAKDAQLEVAVSSDPTNADGLRYLLSVGNDNGKAVVLRETVFD